MEERPQDYGYAPAPNDPHAGGQPDYSEAASKKLAAGLTAILLAGLGVHKFILGYNTAGIIMLVVTVGCTVFGACLLVPFVGAIAMGIVSVVEGIIYLTKSDREFYETYMLNKREWF